MGLVTHPLLWVMGQFEVCLTIGHSKVTLRGPQRNFPGALLSVMKERPRDTNQLAKFIVDVATGQREESLEVTPVNEFARSGGLKGGKARAKRLSPERRSEIASAAARARWQTDG